MTSYIYIYKTFLRLDQIYIYIRIFRIGFFLATNSSFELIQRSESMNGTRVYLIVFARSWLVTFNIISGYG